MLDCARGLVRPDCRVMTIAAPGTMDGGAVLVWGDRVAIGVSGCRTEDRNNKTPSSFLEGVGSTVRPLRTMQFYVARVIAIGTRFTLFLSMKSRR